MLAFVFLFLQPEPLPPLWHLEWFPPAEVVEETCDFLDAHLRWLDSMLELYPNDTGLTEWAWEVRRRRAAWEALRVAHCSNCCEDNRRWKLDELLECLGERDYYAGRMPPAPMWRFRRLP